jgi:hypothetical protein
VIEWARVPWTLWVYTVFTFGETLRVLLGLNSTPVLALVFYVAFMLAWVFFLLRGIRWVWIASLVVLVLGTLSIVAFGPRTWLGALSGLITFGLLLAPPTRHYFAEPELLADA